MAGCAPGRRRWPGILVLIFLSVGVNNNCEDELGDGGDAVQHDPEKKDSWVGEHEKNTKKSWLISLAKFRWVR